MSTQVHHKKKFFDFFPTPKFLEMPSVGIDISDQAIRFVEITRSEYNHHKFRLASFGEKKIPEGVVTSGLINKPEEIKKILAEIRKEHGYKFISASLPEEKGYLFKTEVPNIGKKDIAGNIELKLEENVPIRATDAVFDFSLINAQSNSQQIEAVVTVMPSELVDSYTEIFESVFMVPVSYELITQAVAQSIIPRDEKETYLIVYIGDTRTGFGIVSDGALQFTSTINIGAVTVSTETGNKYDPIKTEVTKLGLYWQDHIEKNKSEKPIKGVVLCGREAVAPGFKETIAEAAGCPVNLANVWTNVFDFKDHLPELSFENSLDYAPAIGLSLSRYYHAQFT